MDDQLCQGVLVVNRIKENAVHKIPCNNRKGHVLVRFETR
jgi:hypothetical protein